MLTRSAWAGMQRWGAALWSGDTRSTFDSLKVSIQAGLNTQLSGIAWWTTDIGGYAGGRPSDPTFRELIVRWFQYGATCLGWILMEAFYVTLILPFFNCSFTFRELVVHRMRFHTFRALFVHCSYTFRTLFVQLLYTFRTGTSSC